MLPSSRLPSSKHAAYTCILIHSGSGECKPTYNHCSQSMPQHAACWLHQSAPHLHQHTRCLYACTWPSSQHTRTHVTNPLTLAVAAGLLLRPTKIATPTRAHHYMCTATFINDACSSQLGGRKVLHARA
jgi:hypothetical protein